MSAMWNHSRLSPKKGWILAMKLGKRWGYSLSECREWPQQHLVLVGRRSCSHYMAARGNHLIIPKFSLTGLSGPNDWIISELLNPSRIEHICSLGGMSYLVWIYHDLSIREVFFSLLSAYKISWNHSVSLYVSLYASSQLVEAWRSCDDREIWSKTCCSIGAGPKASHIIPWHLKAEQSWEQKSQQIRPVPAND